MMGENHREPVTIERRNIPLCQVLKEKPVLEALRRSGIILDGPDEPAPAFARLAHSPGTFEQYLCLAGEDRLPQAQLIALQEALDAADRSAPVRIEEQYPWLKNSSWTLRMRDVSYYKVALEYAPGQFLNLDHIECRADSALETSSAAADVHSHEAVEKSAKRAHETIPILYLYPDSVSAATPIRLAFQDRAAVLSFMKHLLLRGTIDWETCEPYLRAAQ